MTYLDLLAALEGVVKAARKDSSDLLSELQAVVHRAVIGYGRGRAARRLRAQEQRQPTVTQAPQAAGRQSNQPAVARQAEPTLSADRSREKTQQARNGPQLKASASRARPCSSGPLIL